MTVLASYAASEQTSKGRTHPEDKPNYRGEYQRDRDRIIHSAAFRRLEYKTQVFVNHEGDMFRTRLTHSIEVAQIGRSIARALSANEDLTEAICLAHDLGHTPFGHAGQDELNRCMKEYGGFEHNLQSLRVVDVLEERYAEFPGLNLTYETREGILKHCSKKNAKGLGELGQRFLHKKHTGLEAQIANIADEIAYNNHDVDDGLRAGLLSIEQLQECKLFRDQYLLVNRKYPDLNHRRIIHEVVRRMINILVSDLIEASLDKIRQYKPEHIDEVRDAGETLVILSAKIRKDNLELKRFLNKNLYQHFHVHRMTHKAKRIIRSLFEEFNMDLKLLPKDVADKIKRQKGRASNKDQAIVIADYIAGMTDRFAIAEYERIMNPTVASH